MSPAWKLMLGPEGAINSALGWAGLTDEPVELLLRDRLHVLHVIAELAAFDKLHL